MLRLQLDVLLFRSAEYPGRAQHLLLSILHLLGYLALVRVQSLGPVPAVILGAGFLLPVGIGWVARRRPTLLFLGPWLFVYLALAFRFVWVRLLGLTVPGYFAAAPVDLAQAVLFLPGLSLSAALYAGAISLYAAWPRRALTVLLGGFAGLAAVWAGGELIGHRTYGVTGSDPYAYVQMAMDLVERGSLLHRFEIFPTVLGLGIPWYPVVHVGYHLPNAPGEAPTVWPVGGSLLFALAYRLGGESALYGVNPLVTIAAVVTAGYLAWRLTAEGDYRFRAAVAVLAGVILLSSHEQSSWARVPMVDAQAELATTAAFLLVFAQTQNPLKSPGNLPRGGVTLRGRWRGGWGRLGASPKAVLFGAGVCLGFAYAVRHTQVLLAPALVILLFAAPWRAQARCAGLIAVGSGSLLTALPDLWYHAAEFGSWWRPESNELALFSAQALGPNLATMWDAATRGHEFGWLSPFVLLGAIQASRRQPVAGIALAAWFLVITGFHLPYAALRLRDLIPEFPVLAYLAALGIATCLSQVRRSWHGARGWLLVLLVLVSIALSVLRVWSAALAPFRPPGGVFGYLTAAQRAAFNEMARVTESDSVIGAALNDGPLDLYSHRTTVRPADWTRSEREEFFCALDEQRRTLYLLNDGAGTEQVADSLRAQGARLIPVGVFDVQRSDAGGTESPREPGALWRVEPSCLN